jgi:hypothetical protein
MAKAKKPKKGTVIGNWYVTHLLTQIGTETGHETTNYADAKKVADVEGYALANRVQRLGPQYVVSESADGSWGIYRIKYAQLRHIFGERKARFVVQTEKQLARDPFTNAQLYGPELTPLVERL